MSIDAQACQYDAILVDHLRKDMAQTTRAALAGAASVGPLPMSEEAEIISHVLEALLKTARRGEAIDSLAGLALQIGRRRAVDLERKRRVAARWVANARVIDQVTTHGAEYQVERISHALKVIEVAGLDVIAQAVAKATGAGPAERKRISRARERVRQVAVELC